jgi:hypothetical protein
MNNDTDDIKNPEFLEYFASNYQKDKDFDWIKFDWNGKNGDGLIDKNMDFRMTLCEYLRDKLDRINLDLIRDLYIEESKASEQTFGIYLSYHLFANELLRRGKGKFLMDYLHGASYSFDTGLASGRLNLDISVLEELSEYVNLELTKDYDIQDKRSLKFAKERFERHLRLKNP